MQKTKVYWPQLDGLRFIAMLLVLIHHSRVPDFLNPIKNMGWAGVDLFLVLSAFLLTSLLRREYDLTAKINLKSYFFRRFLRIWPLYYSFISFSFIWVLIKGEYQIEHLGMYLSHITFTNNIIVGINGFDFSLPYSPHLWTLSLEEQFYILLPLLLPILITATPKKTRTNFLICAAIAFPMAARAAFWFLHIEHNFVWTTLLRCDAFALGMACAAGVFDNSLLRFNGNYLLGVGLILFFGSPLIFGGPFDNYIFSYTLVDIGCLFLVMAAVAGSHANKILSCAPFRYLGKISFGIYVFHWFAISIARSLADREEMVGNPLETIIGIALSISFGIISFELFEKQFLKLKKRFEVIENRPI